MDCVTATERVGNAAPFRPPVELQPADYEALSLDPDRPLFLDELTCERLGNVSRLLRIWEDEFPFVRNPTRWSSFEEELLHAIETQEGLLVCLTGDSSNYDGLKRQLAAITEGAKAGKEIQVELESIMAGLRTEDPVSFALLYPLQERLRQRMHWLSHLRMNSEVPKIVHLKTRPDVVDKLIDEVMKLACTSENLEGKNLNELDVMTLKPRKWINGDVINYFVDIWRLNHPDNVECISMTTYFYPKMCHTEGALRRYLSEYNDWKRLAIPINHTNSHWFLAVMDFEKEQFLFFDSLPMKSLDATKEALVKRLKDVFDALRQEIGVPLLNWDKWNVCIRPPMVPRQDNTYDCGVFTIIFLLHMRFASTLNSPQIPAHYTFSPHRPPEFARVFRLHLLDEIFSLHHSSTLSH